MSRRLDGTTPVEELLVYALTGGSVLDGEAVLLQLRDELALLAALALHPPPGAVEALELEELGGTIEGAVRRIDVAIELLARARQT